MSIYSIRGTKGLLIIGPHHIGDNLICILSLCKIFENQVFDPIVFITNVDIANFYAELFTNIEVIGIPPVYSANVRSVYYGVMLGVQSYFKRFEVVLDLRSDVTAGLTMLLSRASKRLGGPFWITRLTSTNPLQIIQKIRFAHEYYAHQVVQVLSQKPPDIQAILSRVTLIRQKWRKNSFRETSNRKMIFCPGASIATKRWPEHRWATLANMLIEEGFNVEFICSYAESAFFDKVKQFHVNPEVRFQITATIEDAANALSQGTMAVTCDSALSHLSFLMGIPVVTIFGPSQSEVWFPYHLVNSGVAVTLDSFPSCHPCQRRQCKYKHSCIEGVSVQSVITGLQSLLSSHKTSENRIN